MGSVGRIIRRRALVPASVAMLLALAAGALAVPTAASAQSPEFPQCPAVGADTGCAVLLAVDASGSLSVEVDHQPSYSGKGDVLVGVVNNSDATLTSASLTGTNVFGFDGHGICTFSFTGDGYCPGAPTGYEGPQNSFEVADANDGSVVFSGGGLAPGASTYLSLRATPSSGTATMAPGIVASGGSVSGVEGSSTGDETVATFTDANPEAAATDFSASIDWGDGNISTGTVSGGDTEFSVTGSNTYAEEGSYTVTVTITDVNLSSNTAVATTTATVADAPLTPGTFLPFSAEEGVSTGTQTIATFSDANTAAPVSDFTNTTIDWGDASSPTPGTVASLGDGEFSVSGAHTYAEEGTYTVTVDVVDVGGSTTTVSGTETVADAPLTPGTFDAFPAVEGSSTGTQTIATFSDANTGAPVSDFTATIDWGDETSPTSGTVASLGGGDFSVSGSHTYAEAGVYTVTVTVDDVGGSTTTISGNETVADAPLTAGPPVNLSAVVGTSTGTQTVATFSDANTAAPVSDFTTTIDWGDGTSPTPGTVASLGGGDFSVSGAHTYSETGTYTLTVTIDDVGGSTTTAGGSVTVVDAVLTGSANAFTAEPGVSTGPIAVATFQSANPEATASDFSATVDWGDGTANSAGTVSGPVDGTFTVTASHTYASPGLFTFSVTITSVGGSTLTVSNSATVANVAVTCPVGEQCSGTVTTPSQNISVSGTSGTGGTIGLSSTLEVLNCGNSPGPVPVGTLTTVGYTGTNLTVVAMIPIPKGAPGGKGRSASEYDVCYSDPTPFLDIDNMLVTTGILPNCPKVGNVAPCVVSRALTKVGHDHFVEVTFLARPGDPKFHVHPKKSL